jgi:hypothetical protein
MHAPSMSSSHLPRSARREDAPPGGYLAGLAGVQLDLDNWLRQPFHWLESRRNTPWLMQVGGGSGLRYRLLLMLLLLAAAAFVARL